MITSLVLSLPFMSTLAIVMNIYNGDIIGTRENIEYMLWYIPLFFYILFLKLSNETTLKIIIPEITLCFLGFLLNFYWIFAWEYDKKTQFRHRTEFYDTQCLLCAISYVTLMNRLV